MLENGHGQASGDWDDATGRPAVTVDVVVFGVFGSLDDDDGDERPELRVLLVHRRGPPFQGAWAIPGGLVHLNESVDAAARRELEEETGLHDVYLEQLYTFGDLDRDPRTRVISVAYYALLPGHVQEARGAGEDAVWVPVTALPANMAFDHARVLDVALRRLRAKADYAGIAREFLPARFTLRQLRRIYETVLDRPLDRANFTRRIHLTEGDIEETGETDRSGAHRPARLYRYRRDHISGARDKE